MTADVYDISKIPEAAFSYEHLFGRPVDWSFYYTESNPNGLDWIRQKYFYNELVRSPGSTFDPKRDIVTRKGVSFSYYQVASPVYRSLDSCKKTLTYMVSMVKEFLNEDRTRKLWLTCQGQEGPGEGYHSQAVVLFYNDDNELTAYIEDTANGITEPLPILVDFLVKMDVEWIGFGGFYGEDLGPDFPDSCYVYSHRAVNRSLLSGSVDPPHLYCLCRIEKFYKYLLKIKFDLFDDEE